MEGERVPKSTDEPGGKEWSGEGLEEDTRAWHRSPAPS